MIKCIETGIIYASISQASKETKIKRQSISMCVNGKRKSAGGFKFINCDTLQHIECDTATDEKYNNDNENSKIVLHETKEESDTLKRDVTELKSVIDLMVTDFMQYRGNALKMLDVFKKLKSDHEELQQQYNKLQAQQLNNHPQSNDELRAEFDKILEEKRVKWENLVEMYESVCNERDGLTERIQIIISAPEYKTFSERESREGRERAQKEKEAWNIVDDTNDEFSMFASAPRRKTITDIDDDRLG